MNEMNEIGPRLRELREASDYTVERLGRSGAREKGPGVVR